MTHNKCCCVLLHRRRSLSARHNTREMLLLRKRKKNVSKPFPLRFILVLFVRYCVRTRLQYARLHPPTDRSHCLRRKEVGESPTRSLLGSLELPAAGIEKRRFSGCATSIRPEGLLFCEICVGAGRRRKRVFRWLRRCVGRRRGSCEPIFPFPWSTFICCPSFLLLPFRTPERRWFGSLARSVPASNNTHPLLLSCCNCSHPFFLPPSCINCICRYVSGGGEEGNVPTSLQNEFPPSFCCTPRNGV